MRTFLTMFGIAWGIVSITLMVAAGTLVLTVLLFRAVPKGFFPVQDTGVILGVSEAPRGAKGDPIPFANVTVPTTRQGAQADENGNYVIVGVPAGPTEVRAIATGYDAELDELRTMLGPVPGSRRR